MAIDFSRLGGKKIPTIIGIVLLLGGLIAGVVAVGQSQGLFTRAGPTATPRQVKITNIREDGFTVSWISDTSVSGFVKYGEAAGSLSKTVGDERDQLSGEASLYTTHYITIRGLKPKTAYFFTVGSGSVSYDNQGQPYTVTTGVAIGSPPAADTINGKVLLASGQPAPGVIVYVNLEGGGEMSALTRASGVWSLPLSQMRTADLSKYLEYDKTNARVAILAQGADLGTATVTTTTGNDSPVPDITLGTTQNFEGVATPSALPVVTPSPAATASAIGDGFGELTDLDAAYEATLSVKLTTIDEREVVATSSPEIKVEGPVGTRVTITVRSDPQTTTVTVDADGAISWTPPVGLEPGTHTVTLTYTDSNGILQTIDRTFTVLAAEPVAQGGLPSFTATPSATPTSTPTATPRAAMPSTAAGVPESGVESVTLILLMLGGLLFGAGIFWQMKLAKNYD